MLEEIDHVQWSSYRHAFGSADDVPQLLREVAAGGRRATDAIAELFNTIWHQGTVYSASAVSVPLLGGLSRAEHLDTEARKGVLHLIYAIGRGRGYFEVHDDSPALRDATAEEAAALVDDERRWTRSARHAVQQEADALLVRLNASPPELWVPTAVLCIVAGPGGQSLARHVAQEAAVRSPHFSAFGLSVLADFVANGCASADRLSALCELDAEVAAFVELSGTREQDVPADSYVVDIIVDRICNAET